MKKYLSALLFFITSCSQAMEDNDVCLVKAISKAHPSYNVDYEYSVYCNKTNTVSIYTNKKFKIDDSIIIEVNKREFPSIKDKENTK